MANEEQMSILERGAGAWNRWREGHPNIEIDLSQATIYNESLTEIDLSGCNLMHASFLDCNLSKANFGKAQLFRAKLQGTTFSDADFQEADLKGTLFWFAGLDEANLGGADLRTAFFAHTRLDRCDMTKARASATNFIFTDLSEVVGIEAVIHEGPSCIGTETISNSKGKIPSAFLHGCGLSDIDIEYAKLANPDLLNDEISGILYKIYDLRATRALQVSPLFISYSHSDGIFVDKLERLLNTGGIRFWRDVHDMKAGRIEKQIDIAIRQNPTVLLVLSEHSLNSDWVEHEVRIARTLEKELGRDVVCPVALDNSWKSSNWPKRVMEQIMEYNILDFSAWEDEVKFEEMFRKLIDGLQLFYKG